MSPRHFAQLAALSALWGTTFIFTRIAAPLLGPNMSAWLRVVLASCTLLGLMHVLGVAWPRGRWRHLILLSLISVTVPHILYAWSALHLPAGYAALLGVTSVLFGTIASALMKVERMTPARVLGCVLGLAGAALVVRLGPVQMTPMLLTAALACMAGSAVSGSSSPFLKLSVRDMDPLAVTAGMHVVAIVVLLPGALHDWPAARFEWRALGSVAVMGIATSGIAWWAYMRIMRHITPVAALSSNFMIMGFGVLWGVIFLNEKMGPAMYAGGAIITLAVLLVAGYNPIRHLRGTTPPTAS